MIRDSENQIDLAMIDLHKYDFIIIAFSGGKDSLALLLRIIELIEEQNWQGHLLIWHHLVDGAPHEPALQDWPCTEDYCRKVVDYLGAGPIEYSWLDGGFKREMLRQDSPKAATFFETPTGLRSAGGTSTKTNTRMRYPQVSANLNVRWCSSYLKIDVADIALRNQPERFDGQRILFLSGERREESPARAKYQHFEMHRADRRNHRKHPTLIDHYRAVIDWPEAWVWEIIEKWGIVPHPCYFLGFSRCSCMTCIFASDDQMATLQRIAPDYVQMQADYEKMFGWTIHRTKTVHERAVSGNVYGVVNDALIDLAMRQEYTGPIYLPNHKWTLPAGAFGEDKAGPI